MTYKSIIFGYCVDGEDIDIYLVVPDHVTSEQIFAAEIDDEGEYEVVCEAYSPESAKLIAMLLNDYEMAGHA
jgi:poly(A) polymerase Pap1